VWAALRDQLRPLRGQARPQAVRRAAEMCAQLDDDRRSVSKAVYLYCYFKSTATGTLTFFFYFWLATPRKRERMRGGGGLQGCNAPVCLRPFALVRVAAAGGSRATRCGERSSRRAWRCPARTRKWSGAPSTQRATAKCRGPSLWTNCQRWPLAPCAGSLEHYSRSCLFYFVIVVTGVFFCIAIFFLSGRGVVTARAQQCGNACRAQRRSR
jgi:hypothetical protein